MIPPIEPAHWAPYYKICAPCHMQYDYIAHLDPTKEENKFLWDALGINSSDFKMRWSNGKLIRHILNLNLIVCIWRQKVIK